MVGAPSKKMFWIRNHCNHQSDSFHQSLGVSKGCTEPWCVCIVLSASTHQGCWSTGLTRYWHCKRTSPIAALQSTIPPILWAQCMNYNSWTSVVTPEIRSLIALVLTRGSFSERPSWWHSHSSFWKILSMHSEGSPSWRLAPPPSRSSGFPPDSNFFQRDTAASCEQKLGVSLTGAKSTLRPQNRTQFRSSYVLFQSADSLSVLCCCLQTQRK